VLSYLYYTTANYKQQVVLNLKQKAQKGIVIMSISCFATICDTARCIALVATYY